jgi:murein DD-endopeptidase MepM/ murein hydrolase activator NlpD
MRYRIPFVLLIAGILWLPAVLVAQDSTGIAVHVVQRDDTLYSIAQQYGLTLESLAQFNNLAAQASVSVGQTLLIPTGAASAAPQHIVQPGESLTTIATLYGVDAQTLANDNGVTAENPLYVGQMLTINGLAVAAPSVDVPPPAAEAPQVSPAAETPRTFYHTVIPGDTLFKIAQQYGATVAEIASANNIADATLIYAGQQLLIPGIEPPQIAAVLPAPVSSLTAEPLVFVEGQTGRFQLTTTEAATVTGTFLGRTLAVGSENNNTLHTILVGVPIFTESAVYPLSLTVTGSAGPVTIDANIQVVGGGYSSEYINLLEDRNNLLDTNVETAELQLLTSLMSTFTPTRSFTGPMGLPAAAAMNSPFGTRRSYNGGDFDRFHSGADFAGAPGSPILAPAPGVVVMADTLNVRGNATIIDHGWGVFTSYSHQTDIYVSPGERVETGQVIGTVGSTGRVTGAHLHWELWVNGVPVDPMQWVRQAFV